MSRGAVMRPDDRRNLRRPIASRILDRLDTSDPEACWPWPGATNGVGYGVIGRGGKTGSNTYVHRVMYEHLVGPIPAGLVLDHLCRNRICANPKHLQPVTHRTNLLRGEGISGTNARKTHCPQGHLYDIENTYTYPDGSRRCRACAREDQRRRRRQRKESAA